VGKDAFIDALGVQEIGGEVFLVAEEGVAQVSGWIDAKGGEVRLLGEQLYLLNKARVDVSGETGGGTILVGGDFAIIGSFVEGMTVDSTGPNGIITS